MIKMTYYADRFWIRAEIDHPKAKVNSIPLKMISTEIPISDYSTLKTVCQLSLGHAYLISWITESPHFNNPKVKNKIKVPHYNFSPAFFSRL
jgi:hypothetical protein